MAMKLKPQVKTDSSAANTITGNKVGKTGNKLSPKSRTMHTCNFNNTAKVAAALDYFVP
jgi:hypothetical protein